MIRLILIALVAWAASCAAAVGQTVVEMRAPPGYEHFCFPYPIEFEDGSASLTEQSRERLRAVRDLYYRQFEWNSLLIGVTGTPPREEDWALARERARTVLRVLTGLGFRRDRIQLVLDPGAHPQNTFTAMIPPEEVKKVRAAEAQGTIFC